jgi:hypothetical protein
MEEGEDDQVTIGDKADAEGEGQGSGVEKRNKDQDGGKRER